ncbi:hypothetical protein BVI2075_780022 [Burkholderia vietnamiensis]|nr:hypothetical protein BVI2075_780022 [Burkholderia vietnamiensis]
MSLDFLLCPLTDQLAVSLDLERRRSEV